MKSKLNLFENKIQIPTYEMGKDDKNPAFFEKRISNWSIYPYTYQDNLTREKILKSYKALIIENKYLKITVLPEIGGRVHSVFDKITKFEIFYKNEVIKPALIILRGAWICGGVEFNSGNVGHSINTMAPVNYTICLSQNKASITIRNFELNHRTEWSVEISLYKNKPFFETKIKIHNSNPYPVPCYFWTNTGINYTDSLQFFSSAEQIVYHGGTPEEWGTESIKNYPLYNKVDYSWVKHYVFPSDSFSHNLKQDRYVVYDHPREKGIVHIADRHKCRGRKIFTWGQGREKSMWTEYLSDNNTGYCEVQSGMFETQGIQELILPGQIISWKEYWYPFNTAPKSIKAEIKSLYPDTEKKISIPPTPELDQWEQYYNDGLKQFKLGNDTNAQELFEKTIKLKPNFVQVYIWLGIIYYKTDLLNNAGKMFKSALKYDRNKYYLNLCSEAASKISVHLQSNNLIKGKSYWVLKKPWCSFLVLSYIEIASRFILTESYNKAIEILDKCIQYGHDNPILYYYLGYCYIKKNQIKKAERYYEYGKK